MSEAICRFLEWDSRFFALRIATVTTSRLDADGGRAVREWCAAHAPDCVYFRADPDDPETARTAAALGFELVDIRLDFERGVPVTWPRPPYVRAATAADVPALCDIAGTAHQTTRFYFDAGFGRERVGELYRTWIARSVSDAYADGVLVATRDGRPVGYITMHLESEADGRVGLVGVAEGCRGHGIGRSLVEAAAQWCADRGRHRVRVAAQGRNVAGARFYENAGFHLASIDVWYHHWPRRGPAAAPAPAAPSASP